MDIYVYLKKIPLPYRLIFLIFGLLPPVDGS